MSDGWTKGFAVTPAGTGLHMDGTIPQTFRHHGPKDLIGRGDPVVIVRIPDEIEWDDLAAAVADFIDALERADPADDEPWLCNKDGCPGHWGAESCYERAGGQR